MDFLHTLLTPILPVRILNQVVGEYEARGHTDANVLQRVIKLLPTENAMIFVYLVSFFREMLACADKNKLTPEKISEIMCECLVGEDKMARTKKQFLQGGESSMVRADTLVF
jgi:RhoGAP domain